MKQLYDTTKKPSGKYIKPNRPIKDKEGRGQRNRWLEYFEELLNIQAPLNPPDVVAAHTNLPIDVTPPTIEEVNMNIRRIKSGKTVGPDNI
ncbi:unnamed protein product [Schistosoma margrebowiei]|uniref:Uncharacterized protein n=1 Tax=Schistosoma margrebowiei TaxID=48269 RepID=A0A183MP50_9TREM|nr:unnamed protein product [Schistosoma margrebowiei]